jgi:hypothetical protein
MSEKKTSIRLGKAVKEDLKKFGKMGETYEDILLRLMEIAEGMIE